MPHFQHPITSSDSLNRFPSDIICFIRSIQSTAQTTRVAFVANITSGTRSIIYMLVFLLSVKQHEFETSPLLYDLVSTLTHSLTSVLVKLCFASEYRVAE
ncbi:serine/threonine-protein kinase D6PK [Trifolium repens]|jgi:hypothetical protein|nr:serine/threonine-protein kinase D6PK [Trifolium repens]